MRGTVCVCVLLSLLTVAVFFGVLIWRRPALRSTNRLESILSRESGFLLNNWIFMVILAVVLWGTMFPKISEWLTGTERMIGPLWFKGVLWNAAYTCYPSTWPLTWIGRAFLFFILFLLCQTQIQDKHLKQKIKTTIKLARTPRHVPAEIYQVDDIPRTLNSKKVEMSITNLIHGRPVTNKEALANPESLKQFEKFKVSDKN